MFVTHRKKQNIPNNSKFISFDVTSLFTNVLLYHTTDISLKRIYNLKEVSTNIPKRKIENLFSLCTKNVLFRYNDEIYT